MKKILDKLKNSIGTNKRMIIFFSILILIGVISGSFFSLAIKSSDKQLVNDYLNSFLTNIKNNNINYYDTFINSFSNNFLFMIIIWLLGFSIIGLPITLFMYFSKAFSLGFSISSLMINYKFKGLLYSIIYILPGQIFNILALSILMIYSVTLSLKLFSSIIKKKSIDFKYIVNKYLYILLVTFVFSFISSLCETFMMPYLIKLLV